MAAFDDFRKKISESSVFAEKDQFLIKLAETQAEIEGALRLRYRVFNLEQGKGLESSSKTGVDRDEFDEYCFHLIVMDKKHGKLVGTYRIQPGPVASSALGFYAERQYSIKGLSKITSQAVEAGRSCVAPEYRTGAVVGLLWRGMHELMFRSGMRYLFGCVSLETVDPAVGWALYDNFRENGKVSDFVFASPVDGFKLERPAMDDDMGGRKLMRFIPPLFKGYLRLGANICGEPALDREFGTIDYFILLDTHLLPKRYQRHFKEKEDAGQ